MLARTTTPEINKENPKWISRVTKIRSTWQINYPKDRVSLSVRFTHTLTSMVKPFLRKDSRASHGKCRKGRFAMPPRLHAPKQIRLLQKRSDSMTRYYKTAGAPRHCRNKRSGWIPFQQSPTYASDFLCLSAVYFLIILYSQPTNPKRA